MMDKINKREKIDRDLSLLPEIIEQSFPVKCEYIRADIAVGRIEELEGRIEELEGLLNSDDFWDSQIYGIRLYYGDGASDYLHRDVLRAYKIDEPEETKNPLDINE